MGPSGHFSYRFVRWRGFPWATCWEPPSGGQFWCRFDAGGRLPGPFVGKWAPAATFRIDLYAGGAPGQIGEFLSNLLENGRHIAGAAPGQICEGNLLNIYWKLAGRGRRGRPGRPGQICDFFQL